MSIAVCRVTWKSYIRYTGIIKCRYRCDFVQRKFTEQNLDNLMPKDKFELHQLQRRRERIQTRNKKYAPSCISLKVLGSGSRGAPTSLYVSTDHTRYLFNCGEGTQRLAHEHHTRLAKLEHIFLTTATWRNMGGLPGMALTVQESAVPNIKIHGPPGCFDIFKAVERFVLLKDLVMEEATCSEDELWVDSTMSVRYVYLTDSESGSSSEGESEPAVVDDVDYYNYMVNVNGKRASPVESNRRKIAKIEPLDRRQRIKGTMAYVCKLHPKPPTLLLEKCVEKGVPPGPLLGELKAGNDITLEDGTVVLSSEVCTPVDSGSVFIVLECPNEGYLDALTNSEVFPLHQASPSDPANEARCIVHFTPEKVLNNPRYRDWMKKFPTTTRHIIINEENTCHGSASVHCIQHQLHLLHPDIFPILSTEGLTVDNRPANPLATSVDELDDKEERIDDQSLKQEESEVSSTQDEFPLIRHAKTLDCMNLRPKMNFCTSDNLVITPRQYIDETFAEDGFLDTLAELQTEINAREKNLANNAEYPKIIFLGTGSSIPNKTRNTSGILLRLDENRSIILDCGEGTAGQLIRFYGRTEVDKILATIKAIYVSHLHADHHMGLIGLLQERERVTSEPVALLAPEQIFSWLKMYHNRFESIAKKYYLLPNKYLIQQKNGHIAVSTEMDIQRVLEGVKINTALVKHCLHAFAVSITLENGCKIVYSGDTMPCDSLVNLGAGCDLLIHEATMEDDLEEEAKMKCHSTVSQAIEIGERMRAKFVLLTHFSQRYSKIPLLPENGDDSPNLNNVGIAYDNMQVSLSQLHLLPLFYPALKRMFNEFCSLLENKAVKRQKRIERDRRLMDNDELNNEKISTSAN